MIDHQSLNPDWKRATQHGIASRPGKASVQQQSNSIYKALLCPCCLTPIQKQPIAYCQNVKQLDVLGFGYPLFYDFTINCIIILVVYIFSYSIMSLYRAIQNNQQYCSIVTNNDNTQNQSDLSYAAAQYKQFNSQHCYSFMLYFSHVESSLSNQQLVIRTTSFILHILVLLYLRNKHRGLKQYYKERTTLISNYSLLIKGIPTTTTGLKTRFNKFFSRQFSDSPKISQITFIPNLQQIEKLQIERSKLIQKKKQILKKFITTNNSQNQQNQSKSDQLREIDLKLISVKQQIKQHCLQFDKQIRMDTISSEKIIVTFNTQAQRYWVKKQFKDINKKIIKQYFGQKCKKLFIQNAPQPRQIIWENFNLKKSTRLLNLGIGWGLSIIFLAFITGLFYLLMNKKTSVVSAYLQHKSIDQNQDETISSRTKAVFLVYFSLILIIVFNKFGMTSLLHKFSHIQRHTTTAHEQFSFALKYGFGLLFTTAFMTLAVEAITLNNYFAHEFGVVQEETIMFFLNSFFVPFIWLVNPIWLVKIIKRKFYYESPKLTQVEANQLMEDPHYEMGKRYAQILETMWFTFLYSTLIPFGTFLSLIGICLYYMIDKFNLLLRSSIHGKISQKLSHYSTTLLQLTLLFRPVGQLLFDSHIRKNSQINMLSIVFLIVAIIYLLLPWNFILKRTIRQNYKLSEKKYEDIRYKFAETYHTLHPIYRQLYLKDHLKKRNLITDIILPSGKQLQIALSAGRININDVIVQQK